MSEANDDDFWDATSHGGNWERSHHAGSAAHAHGARSFAREDSRDWNSGIGDFASEPPAHIKAWKNDWDKVGAQKLRKETWGADSSDAESSVYSDFSSLSQRIRGGGRGSAIGRGAYPRPHKNRYDPDGSFDSSHAQRSRLGAPRARQHSTAPGMHNAHPSGRGNAPNSFPQNAASHGRHPHRRNFEDELYSDQYFEPGEARLPNQGWDVHDNFNKPYDWGKVAHHPSEDRGRQRDSGGYGSQRFPGDRHDAPFGKPLLNTSHKGTSGFYDADEGFEGEASNSRKKLNGSSKAYNEVPVDRRYERENLDPYDAWQVDESISLGKPSRKIFGENGSFRKASSFNAKSHAGGSDEYEVSGMGSRYERPKTKEQYYHSHYSSPRKLSPIDTDAASETTYDTADEGYLRRDRKNNSSEDEVIPDITSFPGYEIADQPNTQPKATHNQVASPRLKSPTLHSSGLGRPPKDAPFDGYENSGTVTPVGNAGSKHYVKERFQYEKVTITENMEQTSYLSDSDAASYYSNQDTDQPRSHSQSRVSPSPQILRVPTSHSDPHSEMYSVDGTEAASNDSSWKHVEDFVRTDHWLDEMKSEVPESVVSSVFHKSTTETPTENTEGEITKGYVSGEAEDEDNGIDPESDDESEEDEEEDEKEKEKKARRDKFMEAFLAELPTYSNEELSDNSREWKCKACVGMSGEINWFPGISALIAHCTTLKKKKIKEHRYLAKSIRKILDDRGISGSVCGGKVQGYWKGLEKEKEEEKSIIWPPMLVIRNTRLYMDGDNRWVGMGNKELVESFSSCQNIVKGRHAYGPQGHRDLSLLIFRATPAGYHEAVTLAEKLNANGRGRKEWQRPSQPRVGPDNKKLLYGYMAESHDVVEFNRHHKGNQVIDFKLKKLNEVVKELQKLQEEVATVAKLNQKVEQLSQEKQELKLKYDMLENNASLLSEQQDKLKRKNGEIEALHKLTEDNKKDHEKEVLSMEQHYQMKIKELNENFTNTLAEIQKQHLKQTEELRQQILLLTNHHQQQQEQHKEQQEQQQQQSQPQLKSQTQRAPPIIPPIPLQQQRPQAVNSLPPLKNFNPHLIGQQRPVQSTPTSYPLMRQPPALLPVQQNFPFENMGIQPPNSLHAQNFLFSQQNSTMLPLNSLPHLPHPSIAHHQPLLYHQSPRVQMNTFAPISQTQAQQQPNFARSVPPVQIPQMPLQSNKLYQEKKTSLNRDIKPNVKSQQEIEFDIWLPQTPVNREPNTSPTFKTKVSTQTNLEIDLAHQLALVEDIQRQQTELANRLNELQENQHRKKMEWKKKLLEEEFEFEKKLDEERLILLSEYAQPQSVALGNTSSEVQNGIVDSATPRLNQKLDQENTNSLNESMNSNPEGGGNMPSGHQIALNTNATEAQSELSKFDSGMENGGSIDYNGAKEHVPSDNQGNTDQSQTFLPLDSLLETKAFPNDEHIELSKPDAETGDFNVDGWGCYVDDVPKHEKSEKSTSDIADDFVDDFQEPDILTEESYEKIISDAQPPSNTSASPSVERGETLSRSVSHEFVHTTLPKILQDSTWGIWMNPPGPEANGWEKEKANDMKVGETVGDNVEENYWNQEFLKSFEGKSADEMQNSLSDGANVVVEDILGENETVNENMNDSSVHETSDPSVADNHMGTSADDRRIEIRIEEIIQRFG